MVGSMKPSNQWIFSSDQQTIFLAQKFRLAFFLGTLSVYRTHQHHRRHHLSVHVHYASWVIFKLHFDRRMSFPFSLLCQPHEGPQLEPGWWRSHFSDVLLIFQEIVLGVMRCLQRQESLYVVCLDNTYHNSYPVPTVPTNFLCTVRQTESEKSQMS